MLMMDSIIVLFTEAKALALRRVREIDLERALQVPIRREKKAGETNHLSVIDLRGILWYSPNP
jgi:hypothetical protein